MKSIKEKEKQAFNDLKEKFGYKSNMASPRIVKVVVSSGTGKNSRTDKEKNKFVADRLSKITGQKPASRGARKSIASFKVREGETIGNIVTLRNGRMYDFLDRLFNVTIPRIRDFRGFDRKSVDQMGNLTLGIRDHNTFPETADEELRDVFGLAITLVTTAKNHEEATAFLESLGVPFKKHKKENQKIKSE